MLFTLTAPHGLLQRKSLFIVETLAPPSDPPPLKPQLCKDWRLGTSVTQLAMSRSNLFKYIFIASEVV